MEPKRYAIQTLAHMARPFIRSASYEPPCRVLLIKPDHLGDLLLVTPALQVLREALPAARIGALVSPASRRMWQGLKEIDVLHVLPFPGFERSHTGRRSLLQPYLTLVRYATLLRREGYRAALLLRDDHWWGAALALLAGIPRRIGYAHPLCAPLLSDALPFDPGAHVTRQALAVAAHLTGKSPEDSFGVPPLRFVTTDAERAWAAAWYGAQLAPTEHLVVIHPGAGGQAKHWPADRWAAAGDALAARGWRVLLTGSPDEAPLVRRIAAMMHHPPLTLVGETSLGQLAALFAHASLVIGVDSGPLHLAVSQGTPTLHLFGPSDPGRFGPWGAPDRHRVIRAGLPCSPCHVLTHCPRGTIGPECMLAIRVEDVVAAAERLIRQTEGAALQVND